MGIKTSEISEIIKRQISGFEPTVDISEIGTVIMVGDGIARVYGLEKVMYGELLEFPHSVVGIAFNLEEDNVGAVLIGESRAIKEGDTVKRTKRIMEVPVGEKLVGRVVNALGHPLDGKGPIETNNFSPLERLAPGVVERKPVKEPLQKGLKTIDSKIQIEKGRRKLIKGESQTGKTALALNPIITRKVMGLYAY